MSLALEARAMRDDILIGDTPKAKRRKKRLEGVRTAGRLWKHSTLADIEGLLTPDDLDAMFVFTLVRNPWDRAVSYYHWLQGQTFDHPAVSKARALSFAQFWRDPDMAHSFAAHPAAFYVTDASGAHRCSLYIRLERFEQDARPLFDHLGFDLQLPVSNASQRNADYRRYYDDGLADYMSEVCAADIARFNYQFDPIK